MTLFNGEPVDLVAFNQGERDWIIFVELGIRKENPYEKLTNQWYSWNKGWNAN